MKISRKIKKGLVFGIVFLLIAMFFVGVSPNKIRSTSVSGTISTDTTWDLAGIIS